MNFTGHIQKIVYETSLPDCFLELKVFSCKIPAVEHSFSTARPVKKAKSHPRFGSLQRKPTGHEELHPDAALGAGAGAGAGVGVGVRAWAGGGGAPPLRSSRSGGREGGHSTLEAPLGKTSGARSARSAPETWGGNGHEGPLQQGAGGVGFRGRGAVGVEAGYEVPAMAGQAVLLQVCCRAYLTECIYCSVLEINSPTKSSTSCSLLLMRSSS